MSKHSGLEWLFDANAQGGFEESGTPVHLERMAVDERFEAFKRRLREDRRQLGEDIDDAHDGNPLDFGNR